MVGTRWGKRTGCWLASPRGYSFGWRWLGGTGPSHGLSGTLAGHQHLPVALVPVTSLSNSVWSQDGPVGNTSPLPEESSRDQPDDWRDLPCVAQFEPPPVLLDTDR